MSFGCKKILYSSQWCYLCLLCVGGFLYFKTLFFGLTYLDDNVWLLDYHWYLKDLSNISNIFRQADLISKVFYRPILSLSFVLDAQIGGQNPFVYHLTNLLIHLINSVLVFNLLHKLGYHKPHVFVASLIFTVHPALTGAVVWIPGRTDSLLALFIFVSFILFLNSLEVSKPRYVLGHFFFLILALLTKETAVVFPLMCLFYLFCVRDANNKADGKLYFVLWIGILGLWFLIRHNILAQLQVPFHLAVKSFVGNLPVVISYLGKVFLPFNLSVLPVLEDLPLYYGLTVFALLVILYFVIKPKSRRYFIFGIAWFLAFLLPSLVLGFLQHEYRLYVPMVGCLIMVLECLRERIIPKWLLYFMDVVFILFFTISYSYSEQFKDRMTFWHSAVTTSPHSSLAHRNLGAMYHLENKIDEAEVHYQKALELNPNESMVYNNLALIHAQRGLLGQAEEEYKKEIEYHPDYDNAYANLGLLYYREGRLQEAATEWEETIKLNPKYIAVYSYLAVLYYNQNNLEKARYYINELQRRKIPIPEALKGIY